MVGLTEFRIWLVQLMCVYSIYLYSSVACAIHVYIWIYILIYVCTDIDLSMYVIFYLDTYVYIHIPIWDICIHASVCICVLTYTIISTEKCIGWSNYLWK